MTTEQIIKRSFLELNGAVLMILFSPCFNLPHYKTSNSRIFFPFQITPRKSNEINATPKSKVKQCESRPQGIFSASAFEDVHSGIHVNRQANGSLTGEVTTHETMMS